MSNTRIFAAGWCAFWTLGFVVELFGMETKGYVLSAAIGAASWGFAGVFLFGDRKRDRQPHP